MAKAKTFSKGELVTYITRGNGNFYFQTAKVESCGAKKMTLSDDITGQMMGSNFRPEIGFGEMPANCNPEGDRPAHHYQSDATFKLMSDEAAEAFCLQCSAEWLVYEIKRTEAQINESLASRGESGYVAARRKDLEELKARKPKASKR